jgi:DNA repair protein RecN (Recombination protein N)
MLRALSVRDMILIDRLELEFQPGLNVLTGETGAGKSILLDSLGFVLGWRGRADLVRDGADLGEVTAEFDLAPDHPAIALLDEAGFDGGGTLILRRQNRRDGRKQAWINDRRCTGDVLRKISETLVELHGQQDDRGLLNPRGHQALLDGFAGNEALLATSRAAWRQLKTAEKELAALRARIAEIASDRDYLSHAVRELDELNPVAGEDAELDAKRRLMQAAARIRDDITKAAGALGNGGAEAQISEGQRWLEAVENDAGGRLAEPLAALARCLEELAEAQEGVARCLEALDFNPHELEAIEERLFAIRALARKHGVQPDDLGDFTGGLRESLAEIEGGEAGLVELEDRLADATDACVKLAGKLNATRRKAANRLDKIMAAELAPLKMERAVFTTEISPTYPGAEGADAVQFSVATNPGASAGPLNKIASGGELSRFMLALKVCLHGGRSGQTLIFDEIDRGVGGATADAVGRRLAALGAGGQVLVVTHSPQVAAQAQFHWKVSKSIRNGVTQSAVEPVTGRARVDELARMLAGDQVTDQARAAARVLLDSGG